MQKVFNKNEDAVYMEKNRQTLALVRTLNKESHAGLLFCYKALKKSDYDYNQALAYLKSDAFKHSVEMKNLTDIQI